jgi:taurine dioxygenase
MSLDDLERFAQTLGPFGVDPYFDSVPGHPHIAQIRREADETSTLFAEAWHSDWSFLPTPPAATVLYGNVIPPVGGDTLFANQYAAWDALSADLKAFLSGRQGIHSARRGYSRQGAYGERDQGRSMAIKFDDSALATQLHPIGRVHPETGRTALFVSPGYTIGIEGMSEAEATRAADRTVPAPGARGVRLSAPVVRGDAGDVGQPLHHPRSHRRLPGPRAPAASDHGGGARAA